MVYVNNGQVHQSPPWNFQRIVKLFDGAVMFVVLFFKTLVGLETNQSITNHSSGSSSMFRGSGSSGGGGGGGSGGRRPFGPGGGGGSGGSGGGPRIRTMRDINPPTVGGCAGGSCGM